MESAEWADVKVHKETQNEQQTIYINFNFAAEMVEMKMSF